MVWEQIKGLGADGGATEKYPTWLLFSFFKSSAYGRLETNTFFPDA